MRLFDNLQVTSYVLLFSGHNTDGKYFVTSNKMEYKCEMIPRKVNVFIEKTRDGHVIPVTDVDVREVACGLNHTVSGRPVDEGGENDAGLHNGGYCRHGNLRTAGTDDEGVLLSKLGSSQSTEATFC